MLMGFVTVTWGRAVLDVFFVRCSHCCRAGAPSDEEPHTALAAQCLRMEAVGMDCVQFLQPRPKGIFGVTQNLFV